MYKDIKMYKNVIVAVVYGSEKAAGLSMSLQEATRIIVTPALLPRNKYKALVAMGLEEFISLYYNLFRSSNIFFLLTLG